MNRRGRMVLCVVVASTASAPAFANDRATSLSLVNRWYAAMAPEPSSPSSTAFYREVLSDDAAINLADLGITQNRDEFLDSLDAMAEPMAEAHIAYRTETDDFGGGAVPVIVCYMFTGTEYMTREVFTVADGKIVLSDQSRIAESCDAF